MSRLAVGEHQHTCCTSIDYECPCTQINHTTRLADSTKPAGGATVQVSGVGLLCRLLRPPGLCSRHAAVINNGTGNCFTR